MYNLIKAEIFILFKSYSFKILAFCSFITGCLAVEFNFLNVVNENITGVYFVIACQEVTFFNMVFGCLFAASFICSGFKRMTYGNSLLSGNSRLNVFFAKFIVSLAGMFILSVMAAIVPFIKVLIDGTAINPGNEGINYILLDLFYALAGLLAQFSVIIFLAVALKSGTVATAAGIGFTYILLVIKANMRFYEKPAIEPYVKYIYLYQVEMYRLREDGFLAGPYLAVIIGTFIVTLILSAWIFVKRELK